MKHLFVPYELAVKLKEKGFRIDCMAYYNSDEEIVIMSSITENNSSDLIAVPIYQQVLDWLRNTHDLLIECTLHTAYYYKIEIKNKSMVSLYRNYDFSEEQYYESLEKAIEEALKLI